MRKLLLTCILACASIISSLAFQMSDVRWWVASTTAPGTDKAAMFIHYPGLGITFVWGYTFDASQTVMVGDMMADIEAADDNLTFDGVDAGFLNEAEYIYNGTTYSGATSPAGEMMSYWMYNVNDVSAPMGLSGQELQANDLVLWEYKTDWSSWDCTAVSALTNLVAVAGGTPAEDTPSYTVTLAQAVWNFDDYSNSKPVLNSDNFVCPSNWIVGNAGTSKAIDAYLPFIYPSKLNTTDNCGYDGRLCERIYGIASAGRTPVYAVLPLVSDASYDTLKLCFYGKAETSVTSTTYYGNLKVGYITSLADTLKANFPTAVTLLQTVALSADQYTRYELPLASLPAGARLVFYDDDATKVNSCLLDNISIQPVGAATPTEHSITTVLTHYSAVAGNPTAITDPETDEIALAFIAEHGYELDQLSVTLGGVALDDLMQNWYADPYYYTTLGHDTLYLTIGAMEDYLFDDIVVTLSGKEIETADITIIPGAATFEEYTMLAETGALYNPYDADGTHYWQSGDYTFSCTRSWGGMMNDGFYPANYTDTTWTTYADDYKAITCGAQEGTHYASMYYGGSWGGPCTVTCSERVVNGTYVTLAINPYLCIHGRSYCAAFADGDYLQLHAIGKKNGVYTGTSADFYLADFRNGMRIEALTWEWFDLSGLGSVDEIEFVIYDSQAGAGVGLYCCFDNFGAANGQATACQNVAAGEQAEKIILNGQVLIRKNGHIYTATGVLVR